MEVDQSRGRAAVHVEVLKRGPVAKREVDEWIEQIEQTPPKYGDILDNIYQHCTPQTFGHWSHRIYEHAGWAAPHYVLDAIGYAYDKATPAQRLVAMFHAFGIETDSISIKLPASAEVADRHFEQAAKMIVFSIPQVRIKIGLAALKAQSNFDAYRLVSDRMAKRAVSREKTVQRTESDASGATRAVTSQQMDRVSGHIGDAGRGSLTASARPARVDISASAVTPKAAIVLVRGPECAEVATFVRAGTSSILTADAKYLAAELSVYNQWHLVLEGPVRVAVKGKGFHLKSATIVPDERRIKMFLYPSSASQSPEVVTIPRLGQKKYLAKGAESVAIAVLALLFSEIRNLKATRARSDLSVAKSYAWKNAVSVSVVYRFRYPIRWRAKSRFIVSSSKAAAATARRPTDVRGSFRWVNGVKYPVKAYHRRS